MTHSAPDPWWDEPDLWPDEDDSWDDGFDDPEGDIEDWGADVDDGPPPRPVTDIHRPDLFGDLPTRWPSQLRTFVDIPLTHHLRPLPDTTCEDPPCPNQP